jgi:hypothetical protein
MRELCGKILPFLGTKVLATATVKITVLRVVNPDV